MLNESTIRSFLILVREGSYTKTARRLYLSQQAVSKQMAKLEEDLGCTLLRREQGKLTLTEAGKVYYDAFSRMDAILDEAKRRAGQMADSWDENLVVGVLDAMILPPVIRELNRRFRTLCSDVRLSYKNNTTGLHAWLEEGKIDIAFTLADDCSGQDWQASIPIASVPEILAVCADHPLAVEGASYLDFRNEPVLYTPNPAMEPEEQFRKILPEGFTADRMVPMDDFMASSVAAEQMQGVMFLHEGTRLDENRNFRFYPTGRENKVVMAYSARIRKRCVRRYVNEAKRLLVGCDETSRDE